MTAINLGYRPVSLTVTLAPDTDFVSSLVRSDGNDWPDGTTLELLFTTDGDDIAWAATIDGPRADWVKDHAEVAALLASNVTRARLRYTVDGTELVWARGGVISGVEAA